MNTLLKNKEDIIAWLDSYDVAGYTLIQHPEYGFIVDVVGSVDLRGKGLTRIAVKFGKVGRDFDCGDNALTSLEGAPSIVVRNFDCFKNNLTSLAHSPESVGSYSCPNNKLTSLVGAPKHVAESFDCSNNELTTLEGAPSWVRSTFSCQYNQLDNLIGGPEYVGIRVYCYNNNLKNLDGMPQYVGMSVYCYNNPLLGEVQEVNDFNQIKLVYEAEREKRLVSDSITQSVPAASFKI